MAIHLNSISCRGSTMLWQVMLTSTFVPARAEQSGALALPSAAEGRAKHHPLAGLSYTHGNDARGDARDKEA